MKLPNEIVHGFSFEKDNPTWNAIIKLLDASIESETSYALSFEMKGEDRVYYSGRASALVAFKDVLVNTRNDVLKDIGRPVEDYD